MAAAETSSSFGGTSKSDKINRLRNLQLRMVLFNWINFFLRNVWMIKSRRIQLKKQNRNANWFYLQITVWFTFSYLTAMFFCYHLEAIVHWNLSKPNLIGTSFYVLNKQVKLTKIFYTQTWPKVRFIQDSVLFRVWFRKVSENWYIWVNVVCPTSS